MQDFLDFLVKYWYFSGPFVVIFILLIFEEARSKGLMQQLSPQKTVQLMNKQQAVIVDIREREAFKQSHIINAVNIAKSEIERNPDKLTAYKDRPLVLVCANGQNSGQLAVKLRKQGFTETSVLSGGLAGWKSAGMPLVTK